MMDFMKQPTQIALQRFTSKIKTSLHIPAIPVVPVTPTDDDVCPETQTNIVSNTMRASIFLHMSSHMVTKIITEVIFLLKNTNIYAKHSCGR